MAFRGIAVFIPVLIIGVGFANADSENDGYSGEVMELFNDLTQFESIQSNITHAKKKMNNKKFQSETWDRKYAVALINLYTQNSSFQRTLNLEMRKGYPSNNTNIWRRSGELMNRGLDILGPTTHIQVYRGCHDLDDTVPVVGQRFVFNHIVSTSLLEKVAQSFRGCNGKVMFNIKNVYGVYVKEYSDFPSEKEVTLKSDTKFNVIKTETSLYTTYYLDGGAEVNSGNKQDEGIGLKYAFAVMMILTYYDLL